MTPKLPVPTDNVYKFYALFGLVILLSSAFGIIYATDLTNKRIFEIHTQIGQYKEDGEISSFEEGQIQMLEKLNEVALTNKELYMTVLAWSFAISIYVMMYGFYKWHMTIQRMDDRLTELKIRQLERDLKIFSVPKKPKEHPWR